MKFTWMFNLERIVLGLLMTVQAGMFPHQMPSIKIGADRLPQVPLLLHQRSTVKQTRCFAPGVEFLLFCKQTHFEV